MKMSGVVAFLSAMILGVALITGAVGAQEKISIKGRVTIINLSTNTVVVTTFDKREIELLIEDELTLDKLRKGKVVEGDEVNVKYVIRDGKNVSTYFRKSAGC
ncbi:MAG: hypothetical protein ACM3ON_01480 [Chloroflexota bacterium]